MADSPIIRPGARRPSIPQGSPMKSRLDRRAAEKETSWKKEWAKDPDYSDRDER